MSQESLVNVSFIWNWKLLGNPEWWCGHNSFLIVSIAHSRRTLGQTWESNSMSWRLNWVRGNWSSVEVGHGGSSLSGSFCCLILSLSSSFLVSEGLSAGCDCPSWAAWGWCSFLLFVLCGSTPSDLHHSAWPFVQSLCSFTYSAKSVDFLPSARSVGEHKDIQDISCYV